MSAAPAAFIGNGHRDLFLSTGRPMWVSAELPARRAEVSGGEQAARMPSAGKLRKSAELEFAGSLCKRFADPRAFLEATGETS
jgi:hypothetical protein